MAKFDKELKFVQLTAECINDDMSGCVVDCLYGCLLIEPHAFLIGEKLKIIIAPADYMFFDE